MMYPLLSTSISWHEDSHVELDVLNKRSMQNVKFGNTFWQKNCSHLLSNMPTPFFWNQ